MGLLTCKRLRFLGLQMRTFFFKCVSLACIALTIRALVLYSFSGEGSLFINHQFYWVFGSPSPSSQAAGIRADKFLEVPQIVWGLNNQKIAFARACLTARMLNRSLLMPSLSASLFYKEVELLKPIAFDKVYQFDKFNSLCGGFVRLSQYANVLNKSNTYELRKGSGRRWTVNRDWEQLREFGKSPMDDVEVVQIVGKNPFLWHDHWPVKDYARIFECLVLVDEIAEDAAKIVSKIRQVGYHSLRSKNDADQRGNVSLKSSSINDVPYVAVHMRIEKDWMIHCKNLEHRSNINEICSSKEEIISRVSHIKSIQKPTVVYLAVADSLLEEDSILTGWDEGLHAYEKKKLGVWGIYNKHPYLIKSAIDYEVCLRADIFVGNSFSTFSSLIVLERTQKMLRMGVTAPCEEDGRWISYAYNIQGKSGGPRKWMTNMSDTSLQAISYGSNRISC